MDATGGGKPYAKAEEGRRWRRVPAGVPVAR